MKGTDFAKELRRKSTDAERKLWGRLRSRRFVGWKFRRQVPMGPYIADFLCFDSRLVIELDGNHHSVQRGYDIQRDDWFKKEGFRVVRFSDRSALTEMELVLQSIWNALMEGGDSATLTRPAGQARETPSPVKGEGEKSEEGGVGREWSVERSQ